MTVKYTAIAQYDRSSHDTGNISQLKKKSLPLLLASISALPGAMVYAQTASLEEIVVTARKRAESIQDVPIAITSFSGEDLSAQGAGKISDIAFHAPNTLFTESLGNNTSIRTTIRGQTQNDIIGTLDASVGTYMDDVIWSRPVGSNITLNDIDRVEVLRGPQGTLFGRNTTGGAVQVYTANPEFETLGRVGATIGNYDRTNYNAMFNTPLVEDKLAMRIAYDAQKRDGWQDNVLGGYDINQDDKQNLAVKFLFTPNDDMEFLLKLDRNEGNYRGNGSTATYIIDAPLLLAYLPPGSPTDPYQGFPLLNPTIGTPIPGSSVLSPNKFDKVYEGAMPLSEFESTGVSLTSTIALSPSVDMKLILGYRGLDYSTFFDLDGSPVKILETQTYLEDHEQESAELLFNGSSLDNRLDWTVGLYYFEENGIDGSDSFSPFGFYTATRGDVTNESQAVFTQLTYELTDQINATMGLRYSEEDKSLTSFNSREAPLGNFLSCLVPESYRRDASISGRAGCVGDFTRSDDSFDYTFMLDYTFDNGAMVYFKTATGFRSGGQNLRGTDALSFTSFAPEEVEEYEIGFKADLLDSRLRTNLAYFTSDYTDIQRSTIVPVAGGATATVVANAASATVQGIEAELTGVINDNWQIGATFGWTDASYDEYLDIDPLTLETIDRSNESFVSTPEYTYSLWTTYNIPLPTGSLDLRADYSWHDEYQSFATPVPRGTGTPAEGLMNARATWHVTEAFDLSLWSRNILDNQYRIAGIDFFGNFGYALGIGNEPRTYGIDATYRFGE